MEQAAPPNHAPQIAYASVNSELSHADPLWLHRIFLGITGVAFAETLFCIESATKALAILSRPAGYYFAEDFWSTLDIVGWGIEWFAALSLLSSPQQSGELHASTAFPRKLLRVMGTLWVLLYLLYSLLELFGFSIILWVSSMLLHMAAYAALMYFIMRVAARTGDALFSRHFPFALTLTMLSLGFSFLIGLSNLINLPPAINRAANLEQVLSTAATVYFLYLLIHLRRRIAAILWPPPANPS